MALYDTPRNISSPDRINQIDSYIKRKSKANILNLESAKSDLRVGTALLNKRLNALNISSAGQESYGLINETIKELNKWIKENTFTVQGKKYLDNDDLIKKVQELEKIETKSAAIKRASHIATRLNLKGITRLKVGRGKNIKILGEALDNNPDFKKAYKIKHGTNLIDSLTVHQIDTLKGTLDKLVRHKTLIPENAITEVEFAERIGLSRQNIKSLRSSQNIKGTARGKMFNQLFKPVTIPKQGVYYDIKDLAKKIKSYNDFMDKEFITDTTIERANKFKNSQIIQKYLDGKNTLLWAKKGRADALAALGKGTTPWQASHAMSVLARAYDGDNLRGIDVKSNKAKANFIFKNLTNLKERDPWSAPVYEQALRQVDKELKGVGSFKTFKRVYTEKMNEIFDQMKIPKQYRTSINEIVPVKGAYRNKIAPYSAFVDLTRSDLNRYIAQHQASLSSAIKYLDENKNNFEKFQSKIKKFNEVTLPKGIANVTRKFGPEAAEQVRLATLVEGTDIEKYYDKTDLDRWKKKGLDLRKYAKQKGYFIDVKGARPFFEVAVEDLKKAVEKLSKKEQVAFCSLLARGGLPGDCAAAIENDLVKSSRIFSEAPATSSAMAKVKNIAKGFLGALGRFGPAAGKYGAIAAAGALAQPLVKQFMNDDPSTYLTDPDQQAGLLDALIEGERPKPRSEILDWGIGAGQLGATAAAVPGTGALYKYRRGLSEAKIPKAGPVSEAGLTAGDYLSRHAGKDYGKIRAGAGVGMKLLSGMFTPAGLLATEPLRIAQKRREGESWGEIATSPMTWMGPAFAPSMTKIATAGMKRGSLLPRLLRLGISRGALAAMGPVGWVGLAASLGWEGRKQYQDYKKGRGLFASDEE